MTSSERCCPGQGSMAHVRGCHNHPEYGQGDDPVLGVLTGQYPARTMPIAMKAEPEDTDEQQEDGD